MNRLIPFLVAALFLSVATSVLADTSPAAAIADDLPLDDNDAGPEMDFEDDYEDDGNEDEDDAEGDEEGGESIGMEELLKMLQNSGEMDINMDDLEEQMRAQDEEHKRAKELEGLKEAAAPPSEEIYAADGKPDKDAEQQVETLLSKDGKGGDDKAETMNVLLEKLKTEKVSMDELMARLDETAALELGADAREAIRPEAVTTAEDASDAGSTTDDAKSEQSYAPGSPEAISLQRKREIEEQEKSDPEFRQAREQFKKQMDAEVEQEVQRIRQEGYTKIAPEDVGAAPKSADTASEGDMLKQLLEIMRAQGENISEEELRDMLMDIPPDTGSPAYEAELAAIEVVEEDLTGESEAAEAKHDEL